MSTVSYLRGGVPGRVYLFRYFSTMAWRRGRGRCGILGSEHKERGMKTLLIVDDERKICEALAEFFAARGFHAVTASTGADAMAQLETVTPDYLLLDLGLPDMFGLDILQAAKKQYPGMRVVVVTALRESELIQRAYQMGAYDFITKPYLLDEHYLTQIFSPSIMPDDGSP